MSKHVARSGQVVRFAAQLRPSPGRHLAKVGRDLHLTMSCSLSSGDSLATDVDVECASYVDEDTGKSLCTEGSTPRDGSTPCGDDGVCSQSDCCVDGEKGEMPSCVSWSRREVEDIGWVVVAALRRSDGRVLYMFDWRSSKLFCR